MQTMSRDIFSTVSEDYLSFYKNRKPDYNQIVRFLHFKKEDVSRATGLSQSSIRWDDKMPPMLKEKIQEWASVLNLVAGHFKGDPNKTYLWFITLNPLVGNVAPRDMIRFGRLRKLHMFVVNALAES